MLLNLSNKPIEVVSLATKKEMQAWIGTHHFSDKSKGKPSKAIAFSQTKISAGCKIEVNGLNEVICEVGEGQWYPIRLLNVCASIDHYADSFHMNDTKRKYVARLLPFHRLIESSLISFLGKTFLGEPKELARTTLIPASKRDEMLSKAELLKFDIDTNEWQLHT